MNKILFAVSTLAATLALTSCGHVSNAVLSDDVLLDKAEFATGIDRDKLTLESRSGSIDSVEYTVRSGKTKYRCYFTSAVAINSDAICQPINGNKKSKKSGNCNALLRAAGRC